MFFSNTLYYKDYTDIPLSKSKQIKLRKKLLKISKRTLKADENFSVFVSSFLLIHEVQNFRHISKINHFLRYSKIRIYPQDFFEYLNGRYGLDKKKFNRLHPIAFFGWKKSYDDLKSLNYSQRDSLIANSLSEYPSKSLVEHLEFTSYKSLDLWNIQQSTFQEQSDYLENLSNGAVSINEDRLPKMKLLQIFYPLFRFMLQYVDFFLLSDPSSTNKVSKNEIKSFTSKVLNYLKGFHVFCINYLLFKSKNYFNLEEPTSEWPKFYIFLDYLSSFHSDIPWQNPKFHDPYQKFLELFSTLGPFYTFIKILMFLYNLLINLFTILFYFIYYIFVRFFRFIRRWLFFWLPGSYLRSRFLVQCSWFVTLFNDFFIWDLWNVIVPVLQPVFRLNFWNLLLWCTFFKPLELKLRLSIILGYLIIKYVFYFIVAFVYVALDFLNPNAKLSYYFYSYNMKNSWWLLDEFYRQGMTLMFMMSPIIYLFKSSASSIFLSALKFVLLSVLFVLSQWLLLYLYLLSLLGRAIAAVAKALREPLAILFRKLAIYYHNYHDFLDRFKINSYQFIVTLPTRIKTNVVNYCLNLYSYYSSKLSLSLKIDRSPNGLKKLYSFGNSNPMVVDLYNQYLKIQLLKKILLLIIERLYIFVLRIINPILFWKIYSWILIFFILLVNLVISSLAALSVIISPFLYFSVVKAPIKYFIDQFRVNNLTIIRLRLFITCLIMDSYYGSLFSFAYLFLKDRLIFISLAVVKWLTNKHESKLNKNEIVISESHPYRIKVKK